MWGERGLGLGTVRDQLLKKRALKLLISLGEEGVMCGQERAKELGKVGRFEWPRPY